MGLGRRQGCDMAWTQRLADLLADRNLREVGSRLGFTKNRLYTIIREGKCPNAVDAVKLCRYLGVAVEDVFGDGAPSGAAKAPRATRKNGSVTRAWSIKRGRFSGRSSLTLVGNSALVEPEDFTGQKGLIPVVAPIAAGEPKEAHDKGFPVGAADAYVAFESDDPNAFGLSVDGASMEPDFRHGDIIIASPKSGHSNEIRDGAVAVVIFGLERTATFKRVRFGTMSKRSDEPLDYVLEPLNPHFPPMRLKTREIAAIHPVIGLVRREAVS